MAGSRPEANVSHLTRARSRIGTGAGASTRVVDMPRARPEAGAKRQRPTTATSAANTTITSTVNAVARTRATRGNVSGVSAAIGPEAGVEVRAGHGARAGARGDD